MVAMVEKEALMRQGGMERVCSTHHVVSKETSRL